jgi:glycosyltransferase involved in cell wall biosynthesis
LKKLRIIYLTNAVPSDVLQQISDANLLYQSHISAADNIFQNNLVQAVNRIDGVNLEVVSVVSDQLEHFGLTKLHHLDGQVPAKFIAVKDSNLVQFYSSMIKVYNRELDQLLQQVAPAKAEKSTDEVVWVMGYGGQIWTALPARRVQKKYGKKYGLKYISAIAATIEERTNFIASTITSWGKKFLKYADGVITLTESYVRDFYCGPKLILPFILSDEDLANYCPTQARQHRSPEDFTICYTGELSDISAAGQMLDIVVRLNGKYRWKFCGSGPYADKLAELAADPKYRVEYLGRVPKSVVAQVQNSADLLLVLRSTGTPELAWRAKYANSSKLTEYLLTGKPALTTDVDSIPSFQRPYLNLMPPNSSTADIIKRIDEIAVAPQVIRGEISPNSDYYPSVAVATRRIDQFFQQVADGKDICK